MAGGRSAGLAAAIVAGLAFLVLATWVPAGPSVADTFDPGFRDWLSDGPSAGRPAGFPSALLAALPAALNLAFAALNLAGSLPVWIALLLFATALVWGRRRLAAEVLATGILAEAVTTVARIVVDRPRPPFGVNTELIVVAGFPSGHVTRTVVFMAALLLVVAPARRHPRAAIALCVGVVGLMTLARIAAGAHYATDTAGGVLLGALIVAGWSFVRRREAAAAAWSPGAPASRSARRP
jgi:membrane-associated phospholipid phosphatase